MRRGTRVEDLPPWVQVQLKGAKLDIRGRLDLAAEKLAEPLAGRQGHFREIELPHDRWVRLSHPPSGKPRELRMFGSNNYLGLANDPFVVKRVKESLTRYGLGSGGTPLYYGRHSLVVELERRLAEWLRAEAVALFSNGAYGANLALVTALNHRESVVIYDDHVHVCFKDGVALSAGAGYRFPHNDLSALNGLLADPKLRGAKDVLIGVEGVYSMDGDTAPLPELLQIAKERGGYLVVDDAHGIGVMGSTGAGTAEHYGLAGEMDATVGTFAKTFGVAGGFLAGSKKLVDYVRVFGSTYAFAATVPPVIAAAVLAGLEVLQREPARLEQLRANVERMRAGLERIGINVPAHGALIRMKAPAGLSALEATMRLEDMGFFVNPVSSPAVALAEEGFRISLTSVQTAQDVDDLLEALAALYGSC